MERELEFKNIIVDCKEASAELFLDGVYIMKFTSSLENILSDIPSPITLYRYFCIAIKTYLRVNGMALLSRH
jgi:hypothetical protein